MVSYENGFKLTEKDITVPEGKIKGKIFFQIEQAHQGGSTSYFIADISIKQLSQNNENIIKDYGYYLFLKNSSIFFGEPFNYNYKKTGLNINKEEIKIIMDLKEKTLKFILNEQSESIDENNKGFEYKNIPIEKPLFPTILLYDENDSIVFLEE